MDETTQKLLRKPTLTVEEAGWILGVKRAAAYEAARIGSIPTIKVGKRKLVVPTAKLRELIGLPAESSEK